MAMQTGMGLSRIVLLLGVGYTGTVLFKNGKLSDVIGELQALVKNLEKKEGENGEADTSDAIAAQVRRLAMEVRQIASARQITVLNGNSGQIVSLSNLVVPAAALGALGYGYMWWKGLSISDLMYVTKRNMANAVSNLTKHLEEVSEALAATKRHLTQRVENLDGKLDEQKEVSKLIKNEVSDVRTDLYQIGYDLDELQKMVSGLDGKIMSLEDKQDIANAGVMYLCSFVNGKKPKMPERLQEEFKLVGKTRPSLTYTVQGLKEFAAAALGDSNGDLANASMQEGTEILDNQPRPLLSLFPKL
ncbi:protein of unknown function DUF1664 [Dillenia turbinata]|uniref:DUF1664 domain-containing protein n=1 Tax=Dillenia turbinata TaxID=194707 RepID=A0AAN8V1T2_9MAGN